jgi:hypothetical protein
LIIKLVNVLPTSVDTKLNLKEFDYLPEALKITLAGNLKDTKVRLWKVNSRLLQVFQPIFLLIR